MPCPVIKIFPSCTAIATRVSLDRTGVLSLRSEIVPLAAVSDDLLIPLLAMTYGGMLNSELARDKA